MGNSRSPVGAHYDEVSAESRLNTGHSFSRVARRNQELGANIVETSHRNRLEFLPGRLLDLNPVADRNRDCRTHMQQIEFRTNLRGHLPRKVQCVCRANFKVNRAQDMVEYFLGSLPLRCRSLLVLAAQLGQKLTITLGCPLVLTRPPDLSKFVSVAILFIRSHDFP